MKKCVPGYEECHHFKIWWCFVGLAFVLGFLIGWAQ